MLKRLTARRARNVNNDLITRGHAGQGCRRTVSRPAAALSGMSPVSACIRAVPSVRLSDWTGRRQRWSQDITHQLIPRGAVRACCSLKNWAERRLVPARSPENHGPPVGACCTGFVWESSSCASGCGNSQGNGLWRRQSLRPWNQPGAGKGTARRSALARRMPTEDGQSLIVFAGD